ncbi:MAG: malate synthase A [Candidatus Eisenbacteria bacterium]|nr:malate synthase A [Candidatus Eisenbacteria bacterium]
MNHAPLDFRPERDLPAGFPDFYRPLHAEFTPRRDALVAARRAALAAAHAGRLPDHLPPSEATRGAWRIALPAWCADQRNQMTGPADDAELVVKMLNSGAPGVMLDLEDSMANQWPNLASGARNILAALAGRLTYEDRKRGRTVGIEPSATVIWSRVRGLHLGQAGVLPAGAVTAASLFDLALIAFQVEPARLRHPLCIYIPKSESAAEARWWADAFKAVARARGWPDGAIKCMVLVESHPLAFQMEEFLFHLRDHILGLNLGRWDYMASLIHFTAADPAWVLPDRNTIPHDVPFFQNLRLLLAGICHRRGALAIGGMTALYPSREDPGLNARALAVLEQDKRNEAACFMDGAWTGHPDQNAIAVAQFPAPNQLERIPAGALRYPDLRPHPGAVGRRSLEGTRAAVRTVIRYRNGVLNGRGASLLDGYMEDLATDRIYRLMIAQRLRHRDPAVIRDGEGRPVRHTPGLTGRCFDEELARLVAELPRGKDAGTAETLAEARRLSEEMIHQGWFDPV